METQKEHRESVSESKNQDIALSSVCYFFLDMQVLSVDLKLLRAFIRLQADYRWVEHLLVLTNKLVEI